MLIKNRTNTIWIEKYRPHEIKDFVGNKDIKNKINQYISTNDIPHLLFAGSAGTGKCLAYDEYIDIEMDVSDDEYKILKKYEIS